MYQFGHPTFAYANAKRQLMLKTYNMAATNVSWDRKSRDFLVVNNRKSDGVGHFVQTHKIRSYHAQGEIFEV